MRGNKREGTDYGMGWGGVDQHLKITLVDELLRSFPDKRSGL